MRSQIAEFLKNSEQDLFRLLRELVLQSSYSRDKAGVDVVGQIISRELSTLPMDLERYESSEYGNNLLFRSPACCPGTKPILLVGHMDTVFPPDSHFNWFKEENGKVFGPGVIDMKGGLVVAIFALKALYKMGLLPSLPITLLCNSDEEIGSPSSRQLIADEGARSLLAMVFECGGLGGEIVTGRKGKTGYSLSVQGKAGHAAFAGKDKASAILELARKTIAMEQLNDPGRQLVVNVGVVAGGLGPNTIAEKASAQIDTRFLTAADARHCHAALNSITNECTTPETHAELTVTSRRDPMEQSAANKMLYTAIYKEAQQLGLPLKEELRSGVSDANIIAGVKTPVIDGLGPIGDLDHSDREYMLRDSLLERTLLTACSIITLWENHSAQPS
ncbi:M20 family metallopeptidase [Desulfosediminicola sp.]|uniref:M20 family metallopeptidase n=1 Tax=Desulfosediminicola sp. TaxID=2886825 RepID=UPI003AF24D5C